MRLIGTKKKFLELIENQIDDDDVVVLSTDLCGTISASKKQNSQKVGFVFAADIFAQPDDIGHIAFGETSAIGLLICKEKQLSADVIKKLKRNEV